VKLSGHVHAADKLPPELIDYNDVWVSVLFCIILRRINTLYSADIRTRNFQSCSPVTVPIVWHDN